MTTAPQETHRDPSYRLEHALEREWLLTNGRGDYAASTPLMCHTRRYHGLLVATPQGHARRHLFLSRFEERLHGVGRSFPLSIARYPGLWSPHGHDALVSFRHAPHPVFEYRFGRSVVTRQVQLAHDRPVSLSRYEITAPETDLTLELRPLLAFRQADSLTYENLELSPRVERIGSSAIRIRPYAGLPSMVIELGGAAFEFEADPVWYRSIEYARDLERGYDGHEDQFCPGRLLVQLTEDSPVVVVAALEEPTGDPIGAWAGELSRRTRAVPGGSGTRQRLTAVAADFLYRRADGGLGVVAGFPWFGEWGRDTFVSVPGLTLSRGDLEACGEVLRGALGLLHRGLMPNMVGDTVEASSYNSADASLWFAWAVRHYDRAGAPRDEILDLFLPALTRIAILYRDGTALGIAATPDHLLEAGGPDLNVTWMDARVNDRPVTPRHGCAVEMNALWYALLAYLEELGRRMGDGWQADAWRTHRESAGRAFRAAFWLQRGPYLADIWRPDEVDRSIRPNMLIAAALEDSPLTPAERRDVVRVAESQLLTPRGLRTLAPDDEAYIGRYSGGPLERDAAYHQGTVWPWLLGFYVEASLRAYGPDTRRIRSLAALLDGFEDHLDTAGLGYVSEVFDGDPPHRPGGTIAQAWSVAEILRAYALLEEAGHCES